MRSTSMVLAAVALGDPTPLDELAPYLPAVAEAAALAFGDLTDRAGVPDQQLVEVLNSIDGPNIDPTQAMELMRRVDTEPKVDLLGQWLDLCGRIAKLHADMTGEPPMMILESVFSATLTRIDPARLPAFLGA